MFSVRTLEHLTKEESKRVLEIPLEKTELSFSKTLIEKIVKETRGRYAFTLPLFGEFLLRRMKKLQRVERK